MNEPFDENSFLLYAARYYNNPSCWDIQEFEEDLARFKYIRRLITKYKESGVLRERLILNHMIVLYNLFGIIPATRMLLFKFEDVLELIVPFMIFLRTLPETVLIRSELHKTSELPCDEQIIELLKEI